MPRLITTKSYEKRLALFIKRHPGLRNSYLSTLRLLEINPNHPSLRLHKLKGRLREYSSVSINMKYRIMIDFIVHEDMILLIDIGSHEEMGM